MKVIYYNNHQDVKVLIADGLAYGRSLVPGYEQLSPMHNPIID